MDVWIRVPYRLKALLISAISPATIGAVTATIMVSSGLK